MPDYVIHSHQENVNENTEKSLLSSPENGHKRKE